MRAEREAQAGTVAVRLRDGQQLGPVTVEALAVMARRVIDEHDLAVRLGDTATG